MVRKICIAVILLFAILACQITKSAPTATPLIPTWTDLVATTEEFPTAVPSQTSSPLETKTTALDTPTRAPAEATFTPVPPGPPTNTPFPTSVETPLSPLTADLSQPYFAGIALASWSPQTYAGENVSLPVSLLKITNAQVLEGLTEAQRSFLSQNGFTVIHSQEAQFGDIRVETARRTGQPYYLTTDAAFHALHLLFDDLLKALEKEKLRPMMVDITQATLAEVQSYLPAVQGTQLEAETVQAAAYLSVALKLFNPEAEIDPLVADLVAQQVSQVMDAGGKAYSVIFPGFEDDYGAYKPVGHYAGDPELEAYYRGMTWYGRVHFLLSGDAPSRLPLIVTLGLRRAQVADGSAAESWAFIHKTLNFMVGPSDDLGPLEYADLMDAVYGENLIIQDIADETRWQEFRSRSDQLPAPQINSLFIDSTVDLAPAKGWRFMGQRFTLDGLIFQNLIFDRVKAREDGTRREFPSGLDVMAAFGSAPAMATLTDMGATSFPNYTEQMTKMQQAAQAQPETQWLGRFYDTWLYSFFPLLKAKDASFPAYMQTSAWSYKDLNAALGSWAELKHDTVLYTKMPEMAGGGGPPMSGPAPSYVEPDPVAFYRMAYMAKMLSCGLQQIVLIGPCQEGGINPPEGTDLGSYVYGMANLAFRFQTFGDIAVKELAGQPLTEEDNDAISICLGMIECMNTDTGYLQPQGEMPKPPVIAAVSGANDSVLEVGVGYVDRIYVVVPLEGKWQVAQGGIFSYYEFNQPRDQRLTDEEWRTRLAGPDAPSLPAWASNFVLQGGNPTAWLAFRIGDIYYITEAGEKLNVREQPSTRSKILMQLKYYDYVEIIDGPVQADGFTWWKFKIYDMSSGVEPTGWAVENQDWYERSYLP
jgi:hypothetical protein